MENGLSANLVKKNQLLQDYQNKLIEHTQERAKHNRIVQRLQRAISDLIYSDASQLEIFEDLGAYEKEQEQLV